MSLDVYLMSATMKRVNLSGLLMWPERIKRGNGMNIGLMFTFSLIVANVVTKSAFDSDPNLLIILERCWTLFFKGLGRSTKQLRIC
jgi:hypothetical protein